MCLDGTPMVQTNTRADTWFQEMVGYLEQQQLQGLIVGQVGVIQHPSCQQV